MNISAPSASSIAAAQSTEAANTLQRDAFGLHKVGSPRSIFNATSVLDKNPWLIFDHSGDGAGGAATNTSSAHDAGNSSVLLKIGSGGATPDGHFVLRASRYIPYTPAHAREDVLTGAFETLTTNAVAECGTYEADATTGLPKTGVVLRVDSTGTWLTIYDGGSPISAAVEQADWNGSAAARAADFTKRFIHGPSLQWLGNGKVAEAGDFGSGGVGLMHTFHHVGAGSAPYMVSASLPLTFCLRASGGAVSSTATIRQTCMSSASISIEDIPGITCCPDIGWVNGALKSVAATDTLICSVRGASPYVPIFLRELSLMSTAEAVYWQVILGGTLGGTAASWQNFGPSTTILQWDKTAGSVSGGQAIAHGTFAAGGSGPARPSGSGGGGFGGKEWASYKPDGTAEVLSIVARSITGVSTSMAAWPTLLAAGL